MSQTVDLLFWPEAGPDARTGLDLSGLGELLSEVCPDRLRFEATFDPGGGSSLRLNASFEPMRAEFSEILRRGVVRLEGEAGFQAVPAQSRIDISVGCSFFHPRVQEAFLPSRNRIAFTLPLAGMAAAVIAGARRLETQLVYAVETLRTGPHPDFVRPLIAALAEAELGMPSVRRLEPGLRQIFSLAKQRGWYAIEAFGVPAADRQAQLWLKTTVCGRLIAQSPGLGSDLIDFQEGSDLPELVEPDFDGFVNGLRAPDYVDDVVALVSQLRPQPRAPRRLRSAGNRHREGPYAFISYAHLDGEFVTSVIEMLTGLGVNVWVDSGIEPGDIWDEVLEDRLERSSVVVVCVSEAYQASRYCKRELKFADLLQKPIIPLAMQQTLWQPGLRFQFQELQIRALDGSAEAVKSKLSQVAPELLREQSNTKAR